jgi:TolB-like protein/class 3 adenylate cyclase
LEGVADFEVQERTLVFTDLVDSTRLVSRLGDRRSAEIFRRHDRMARDLLDRHGGVEIDKSDGFLLIFDRPEGALRYALAYHASLRAVADELGVTLLARVGVHMGNVFLRQNSNGDVARGAKPMEVEGVAKPLAARLMSLARAQQTLLSAQTYHRLRLETSHWLGVTWLNHGHYELYGLDEPIEIFEAGLAGQSPLSAPVACDKGRPVGATGISTLLMIPFSASGDEDESAYLSDGITDEVIADLSRLECLRVISHDSAMQLAGHDGDPAGLAAKVSADFVLSGTLHARDGAFRLAAKLTNASRDVLWADKFQGRISDIFAVQEAIARSIAEALQLRLTAAQEASIAERPIPDIRAYECYLRARHEIFRFTAQSLERAVKYLEAGLQIIGDNPTLHAALGYVYWQHFNAGISSDPAFLQLAKQEALKILSLDARSPHAHRLLGLVEMHAGSKQDAIKYLNLALARNPNDPDALLWLTVLYGFVGHPSSGRPLATRLLRLDPLTPFYQMLPGFLSWMDGDFAAAAKPFEMAAAMDPGNPIVRVTHGQVLLFDGRRAEATLTFTALARDLPDTLFAQLASLYLCALEGDALAVSSALTPALEEAARADMQYSWSVAECLALVGDTSRALDWLGNAVKRGLWNHRILAELDPLLASLRGSDEFTRVIEAARRQSERIQPVPI